MKFTLTNFSIKSVSVTQFFLLFWEAVGILDDKCKLKVMTVTSDRAIPNRTMYQMYKDIKHSTITNNEEKNILYKKKNQFVEDDRETFFICERPYLVKQVIII